MPFCGLSKRSKYEITVLICGCHNAGKTTTVRRLAHLGKNDIVPTLGREEELISAYGVDVRLVDTSGKFKNIVLENDTFDCHAIIFVVDSSDDEHLEQAKVWFKDLLENKYVKNRQKPVLLLGSKQDLPSAKTNRELYFKLDLENVDSEHAENFKMFTTSGEFAGIDKGLKTGLKWLIQNVGSNWPRLKTVVESDVTEYEENAKLRKAERRKQIQSDNTGNSRNDVTSKISVQPECAVSKTDVTVQESEKSSTKKSHHKSSSQNLSKNKSVAVVDDYMNNDDMFSTGLVNTESVVLHPKQKSKLRPIIPTNSVEPQPGYNPPVNAVSRGQSPINIQ